MTVRETGSRVFHIKHEGRITQAWGREENPMQVSEGRGLYLVRLEIPTGVNPELRDKRFGVCVRTNKDHITFGKGLGGGKRGWVGEPIPFNKYINSATIPSSRVTRSIDDVRTNSTINGAIREIFGDVPYDCNVNVCTEFEGYRAGFGPRYDEIRTHLPLIVEAIGELSGKK